MIPFILVDHFKGMDDHQKLVSQRNSGCEGQFRNSKLYFWLFIAISVVLLDAGKAGSSSTFCLALAPVIEFPPKGDIHKARFEFQIPANPEAVLVLIDGQNMPPTALSQDPKWLVFARANHLALCGVQFVSDDQILALWRGYYDVPAGSGDLLLRALDKAGLKGKPLVMFGISGGARFINSFLEWKPELVRAWSAYTVENWCPPVAGRALPPGIVACGQYDDSRYGGCLRFVQEARKLHQPVAWVSLHQVPHQRYIPLEDFTREFFADVLHPAPNAKPLTVDYIKETEVTPTLPWQYTLSCVLPSRDLLSDWRTLNEP